MELYYFSAFAKTALTAGSGGLGLIPSAGTIVGSRFHKVRVMHAKRTRFCERVLRIRDSERGAPVLEQCEAAAVIGGGLLGLEGAKACYDLGVKKVHVMEGANGLMARRSMAPVHANLSPATRYWPFSVLGFWDKTPGFATWH